MSTSQEAPSMLLLSVTLGPLGEWFIRFQGGQVDYGKLSNEIYHALNELLHNGRYFNNINFLDFGENGSYFVTFI